MEYGYSNAIKYNKYSILEMTYYRNSSTSDENILPGSIDGGVQHRAPGVEAEFVRHVRAGAQQRAAVGLWGQREGGWMNLQPAVHAAENCSMRALQAVKKWAKKGRKSGSDQAELVIVKSFSE